MASVGRKPKPEFIRAVEGNPGHRPIPHDVGHEAPPDHDNGLRPPKKLKGRAKQLWFQYVKKAPWLTTFDGPKAFVWVQLQAAFEDNPVSFPSAKLKVMHSIGSELGFDPSSRMRMDSTGSRPNYKGKMGKFAGLTGVNEPED